MANTTSTGTTEGATHIPGHSMASSSTAPMDYDLADEEEVFQEQLDRLFSLVPRETLVEFIKYKGENVEQVWETIVGRRSNLKAALKEAFGLEEGSFKLKILCSTFDRADEEVFQEQLDRLFTVVKKEDLLTFFEEKWGNIQQVWETIIGRRSSLTTLLKEALKLQEDSAILKIIRTTCQGNVEDEQLDEIARKFPYTEYETFGHKLGFEGVIPQNILMEHFRVHRAAVRDMLNRWQLRDGGSRKVLEAVLFDIKAGDLAAELYE